MGLGPSIHDYISQSSKKKDILRVEEVWTVNSLIDTVVGDRGFIMDDLKHIERTYPEWAAKLKHTKQSIITCKAYDDYPTSQAYPIEEVIQCVRDDLFNTTVAYMLGYVLYLHSQDPIQTLYLFGCDFYYPNSQAQEAGAANVCYLLGIAKERGINFRIPQSSSLMDAHLVKQDEHGRVYRPLYGYDYNPGESSKKVKRGTASDLDKKVAMKTPTIHQPKPGGNNGAGLESTPL